MGPYETTVNKQYADTLLEVRRTIEEQKALDKRKGFTYISENVLAAAWDNDTLPHWSHPFVQDDLVYMDPRPFYTSKGNIRQISEFDMLKLRAQVEWYWALDSRRFEGLISPLSIVFAEWVSASITQRFDASEVDRTNIKIIAATYYVWLMMRQIDGPDNPPKREAVENMAIKVLSKKGAGIPADFVLDVLESESGDSLFAINAPTIGMLANGIRESVSVNMGQFNERTLMQLIGAGSWVGNDSMSLALMALEHPPTLAVMIERAENITSYRNKTRIGRAINAVRRQAKTTYVADIVQRMVD